MASDGGPTVAVKLFIDKEKSRVLFAESDMEFVDVLFSFLTLPLGTIVRLLGKNSQLGCLDEIYKSVEDLGFDHFVNMECKNMLLSPANSAAAYCTGLKVEVDASSAIYKCKSINCTKVFTSIPHVQCVCGENVQYHSRWPKQLSGDGVFVKSCPKFIITDDLQVYPASSRVLLSLMDQLDIPKKENIEEKDLQLNSTKLISLLRRALLTKEPLTGLYYDAAVVPNASDLCKVSEIRFMKQADEADPNFKAIKVKLVQRKDDSLLYGEVGYDFADMFFCLLNIPLGSIVKTYSHWPLNGCIDSIYKSVCTSVKQECQSLLLSPKLGPYFQGYCNVLQVEELKPRQFGSNGNEFNPRHYYRGSYIKTWPINFMVTNDLKIIPFSINNALQSIGEDKLPKGELQEKELTLSMVQVLELIGAAISTREVLSSVFLPANR